MKQILVIAITLFLSNSIFAQGAFTASLENDGGTLVVSLVPDGGDVNTTFNQVEFFIRTTDMSGFTVGTPVVDATNFPQTPALTVTDVSDATYAAYWFSTAPTPSGISNSYTDGVPYELARIPITGGTGTADFELYVDHIGFSAYFNFTDSGGNDITNTTCVIFGTCPGAPIFSGDNVGMDAMGNPTESVSSVPLPVELLDFYGYADGRHNILKWETASEENTEFHILERSRDGQEGFQEIGRLDAVGFSTEELAYTLVDENPLGTGYYRLRSVDFDGAENISNTIMVKRGVKDFSLISAYPVPTRNSSTIEFNSFNSTNVEMTVVDVSGKVVLQDEIKAVLGRNVHEIDLSTMAKGFYFVKMNDGYSEITIKLVKE